jgi:hypothetical protein
MPIPITFLSNLASKGITKLAPYGLGLGITDLVPNNIAASQQRNQLRQQNPGFLGQANANLYGLIQTLTGGPFSPIPSTVKAAQEIYRTNPVLPDPTSVPPQLQLMSDGRWLAPSHMVDTEFPGPGRQRALQKAQKSAPRQTNEPADGILKTIDPVLSPEIPDFLQSQAPVVVTTPEIPGQAIGNMAGTDLYNVAKQAAVQLGTQQDLDAVTNLGLAQWRANFPGLAGSPLSPEALQRDVQQEELAIKSQDFMKKYKKLMEANKK